MTDPHAQVRALPVQGARPTLDDSVDLRELIPGGMQIRKPIRYSHDVWDLTGYPLVNQIASELDFRRLPPRWRYVVRDWVLLRLRPSLATDETYGLNTGDVMAPTAAAQPPLEVMSVHAYLNALTVSLGFIERMDRQQLGPKDWAALAAKMRDAFPGTSPQTLAGYCRPLTSLWAYRGIVGVPDMFGGKPFDGQALETVFKVPERGINAERPAPEYCGPLLGLALWIIDHCAEDILTRLEALAAAPDHTGLPREQQAALVIDRLRRWAETGRPLPAFRNLNNGQVSPAWATFVKLSGCSTKVLRDPGGAKKLLNQLGDELGLSLSDDGFDLPITEVVDRTGAKRPWIEALPPTKYRLGLDHWACTLAYCCAYVITILTTVRDRELAALPHDCLRRETYERGDVDVPVTKMRGYLVKNRKEPVPANWVVADDVANAVKILHRLKAARGIPETRHPRTGRTVLLPADLGRARGTEKASDTLKLDHGWLRWFEVSSRHLANRGLTPPLPPLPRWLSHRTIRITGIHAYVSRPWGDALAAEQAHWSSRKVAEGYFGRLPQTVYVADPESIAEAREADTGEMLLDAFAAMRDDDTAIQGGGTPRLRALYETVQTRGLGTGTISSRNLIRLSKDNPNVFVGEFTICIHGPGGLCGNAEEADFLLCRPFKCRNSAMTRAHRARLEIRRRSWARHGGVFARARRKIEEDAPGLEAEFADLHDADLRTIVLEDLPGGYRRAAQETSA